MYSQLIKKVKFVSFLKFFMKRRNTQDGSSKGNRIEIPLNVIKTLVTQHSRE